jgi:hypothetical protein
MMAHEVSEGLSVTPDGTSDQVRLVRNRFLLTYTGEWSGLLQSTG